MPGKPMSYQTTNDFLRMFGYSSLGDLPELPRYRLDENKQIVIDELIDLEKAENEELETEEIAEKEINQSEMGETEAPLPEREEAGNNI